MAKDRMVKIPGITGGLNQAVSRDNLQAHESPNMQNFTVLNGVLEKRKGYIDEPSTNAAGIYSHGTTYREHGSASSSNIRFWVFSDTSVGFKSALGDPLDVALNSMNVQTGLDQYWTTITQPDRSDYLNYLICCQNNTNPLTALNGTLDGDESVLWMVSSPTDTTMIPLTGASGYNAGSLGNNDHHRAKWVNVYANHTFISNVYENTDKGTTYAITALTAGAAESGDFTVAENLSSLNTGDKLQISGSREVYTITAVDQLAKTFTVAEDLSALVATDTFEVTNSLFNNGDYTVASDSGSGPTIITVEEDIPSSKLDGRVNVFGNDGIFTVDDTPVGGTGPTKIYVDEKVNADATGSKGVIELAANYVWASLPGRVRWSHLAEFQSAFDWDDTNTSSTAGYHDFVSNGTTAGVLRSELLRNSLMFYLEDTIVACSHTDDSNAPFRFDTMIPGVGLYAPRLLASNGDSHFFVGTDRQIYQYYGGRDLRRIGGKIREEFFTDINKTITNGYRIRDRSFTILFRDEQAVGFCIPTGSDTAPQHIYKYFWNDRRWEKNRLDDGIMGWGEYLRQDLGSGGYENIPILGGETAVELWRWDYADTDDDGAAIDAFVQTKPFIIDLRKDQRNVSVWFEASGDGSASTCEVSIITSDTTDPDDAGWTSVTKTIGSGWGRHKVDFNVDGYLMKLQFRNAVIGEKLKLASIHFEVQEGGRGD